MDTSQLIAFDRIVREGNFSRAAQALDISQPTISARIQALEQHVGGALFVRGGRALSLTELGESFLPYARRALAVLAEGKEAAYETQRGQRGRLTLGTIESLTGGFFARAVSRFHQSHRAVEVFIRAAHTPQIVEMLEDGVVRLGLMTWPYFAADLVPLLRFREPLGLVVSARHALARQGAASLEEVASSGIPLLQVRWGPTMRPLLARLTEMGGPQIEVPIDSARQLVLDGVGSAFLTQTLVASELEAGHVTMITVTDLPPLFRDSALVRLARQPLPSVIHDFVDLLRQEAGSLCIQDS